jgi:hypothetical protein
MSTKGWLVVGFFEGFSPQAVSIGTALFTAIVTVTVSALKLLISRFDNLTKAIKDQGEHFHEWLIDHEEKDQRRHEENLKRFEVIAVSLAKESHVYNFLY